ncbi:Hpt domain-containing protein [Chenggangzhangella methanolivorans]|uniref:Hpt domain-containing protein n=1 Tax=Chenggangzhangella methanolivorans TaxID=1437009 RepID=A0A9E6ULN2_9HYPH|nr:Hpt domain-containing protein [Chenggangzhangella methanolivorans]QZO00737.1 Hpt domain-containing protein [Chenggangzhangella methanolivorans]
MADQPPLDVPTETYADHIILRPPNRLKARVAQRVDPDERLADPVRRAEHALTLLENEFDQWMDSEINALEDARRRASITHSTGDFEELYRAAHDIRGQAATLGFPLAGEVADGLCTMIERLAEASPQSLVDRHVEAVRAMVREDVRDRDHPLGVALVRRLAELRRQTIPGLSNDA